MKLTYQQICSVTTGAVSVFETDGGVGFDRFTPEQRTAFANEKDEFYVKSFSCGGMRLRFRTDSQKLYLRAMTSHARARTYFSFDLSVNGKVVDSLDNFSHLPEEGVFVEQTYPMGLMEKQWQLGPGEKHIQIYFPWNARVVLEELSLDDGATLIPEIPEKTLLVFGDSITLGFDARRPSNRHAGRLADALGAVEYNKGIGGSTFIPGVTEYAEDLKPDYIYVAYGANDWSTRTKEEFESYCRTFLKNLRRNYPGVPMLLITPIWRADCDMKRPLGPFSRVDEYIREVAQTLPDTYVFTGIDFIPHDTGYYADSRLHPNDEGFDRYFRNLWKAVEKILKI